MEEIVTVKIQGDGYLVNGNMYVPNDPGNRHYIMVQEWIALGNTPDPEFTQAEIDQQALDASVATSREQLKRTEVAETRDGYLRMTNAEQIAMDNFRAAHFDNVFANGVPMADPGDAPTPDIDLQSAFTRFRI